MSLRWSLFLLAAASALAQEYKASDDGRVVYFTGAPVDDPIPTRLWRWTSGNIQTLVDIYSGNRIPSALRLLRLSPDGRFNLIHLSSRWQVLLDGAPRPLVEITDAQLVDLSPNGRWLVVYRNQAGRAVELYELSESGPRSTAVWPDPRPNGIPTSLRADYSSMVTDDAVVRVPCADSFLPCLWNSRTGATQPQLIPLDGTARAFYQWRLQLPQQRSVLYSAAGVSLGVACDNPFADIVATDPTGRRAHLRCALQNLLYNADTNTTTPLPDDVCLNSTLTEILTRPTATQFTWQPISTADPKPISHFDSTALLSAPSPTGLFATSQSPDFTIEWGGQTLTWVEGSLGYHYAYLPADIVPGAVDSFRLTSPTRPWLNVQRDRTVPLDAFAAVPINATDPRFLFLHEDYSGLVTPGAPARPGERIHLYITGVDVNQIGFGQPTGIAAIVPLRDFSLEVQQPVLPLRMVDLQPTIYSRALQILTLEVPQDMAFNSAPTQTATFVLQLRKKAGDEILASGPVWFSISPN